MPQEVEKCGKDSKCEKCGTRVVPALGFCLRCGISEQIAEVLPAAHLAPYLERIGWVRSVQKKMPMDREGKPLPWITYPAIIFLKQRIASHFRVFEFGSGNSTLWWSSLVKSVVSCEHDKKWFTRMKEVMPANVEYIHRELEYDGEYCRTVMAYPAEFDILVIDGRDRINCAKNGIAALKEGGVVLWDNSNREKYAEGYGYLAENGFRRLDFYGLGPINVREWCTSIFYRKENCLEL